MPLSILTLSPLLSHPPKNLKITIPTKSSFKTHHHSFFHDPNESSRPFHSITKSFPSETNNQLTQHLLSDQLISRASTAKDAEEALNVIAEGCNSSDDGVVSVSDSCKIVDAAIHRDNHELVLSIFNAMLSSAFRPPQGVIDANGLSGERWKWSRPDAAVYMSIIRGLASSLRVSDALMVLSSICQVGVSGGEEFPLGKWCGVLRVRLLSLLPSLSMVSSWFLVPSAAISMSLFLATLPASSLKRSGYPPAERSMSVPAWKRGLRFLQIMKQSIPSAVHSIVVQTPSGSSRTYRFATKTVDLPAREGERVTIALAAPENIYKEAGPFKIRPKVPNFYPGEPMCLTNHKNGYESPLLRAPVKDGISLLLKPSTLFPALAVLATGDAASGFINPNLPQVLSVAAVTSLAVGTTLNVFILPQLNQLPQRSVEITAIKQKLLSQYDLLQSRIKDLKDAAEKEIWMFARMCQLENKIFAVGEPTYRARRSRVKRVREGLENSLKGRIELLSSYAKISSMIEIEVEMDTDVLAAEAASDSLADQIQQIMELEDLEEKWKLQAEANDEAERILSSEPIPTEQA